MSRLLCAESTAGAVPVPSWDVRATVASGAQLGEARGSEVAIEGERFADAPGAHEGEARRIDEGVLALIVAPKPAQRLILDATVCEHHLKARRVLHGVEEVDGRAMSGAPAQERPRLAADVVGRDERHRCVLLEQFDRLIVVSVAAVAQRHPERRVDEDHRYTTSSTGAGAEAADPALPRHGADQRG